MPRPRPAHLTGAATATRGGGGRRGNEMSRTNGRADDPASGRGPADDCRDRSICRTRGGRVNPSPLGTCAVEYGGAVAARQENSFRKQPDTPIFKGLGSFRGGPAAAAGTLTRTARRPAGG